MVGAAGFEFTANFVCIDCQCFIFRKYGNFGFLSPLCPHKILFIGLKLNSLVAFSSVNFFKNIIIMKDSTISSKDLLIAICSLKTQAMKLLIRGNKYNQILDVVIREDYAADEFDRFPLVGEFRKMTGLSSHVFRKCLENLYFDLVIDHENRPNLSFEAVKYYLHIQGLENSILIWVDSFPVIPNVGNEISIYAYKSYLGSSLFHVEEVRHEFEDSIQIIGLYLKHGKYNKYWELRKDRARCLEEVHWRDFYNLREDELRSRLNDRYSRW